MPPEPVAVPPVDPRSAPTDRKPLTWLGCGCALLVAAVLSFVVAGSFATWRAAERFREGREDPAVAAEQTREVLPWSRLPEGYHPTGAMEMPLGLLRMAVFADSAPGARPGGDAGSDRPPQVSAGFFFVDMPDWMNRKAKMARVFRGEEGDPGGISQVEVRFESREELGRGELTVAAGRDAANVLYYARRGDLEIQDASFGLADEDAPARRVPGIATMLLFDCPGVDRLRLGLWFATDPAPEAETPEADLTATPADPDAIAAFLSGFDVCG